MDLFNDEGHITQEGFTALSQGRLDELSRLETAEHLSFCEECFQRYEQNVVLAEETPTDIAKNVKRAIFSKKFRATVEKYAVAAAAAFMLTAFWNNGFFSREAAVKYCENSRAAANVINEKLSGARNFIIPQGGF